jgi:hypothetical protein
VKKKKYFVKIRILTSACLVSVFTAVDQSLGERIAKAIGHAPVQALKVPPAEKATRFSLSVN